MVRERRMARRALLRTLWVRQHDRDTQAEASAVLVPRLPQLLQRQNRNGDRSLEGAAQEVGRRDLPVPNESQERIEHEAAPRPRSQPENGVVHAAPHS